MNNKLSSLKIGVISFCTMAGCAFGATYTLTNGLGVDATGIGDSTGDGFVATEGIVALGVFSSNDFLNFTSDDFITNFTAFGVPTSSSFRTAGILGNNGLFEYTPAGVAGAAAFVNMPMVALVGNAATFAAATEFLVLDLARNFLLADDSVATPITISVNGSTNVLFGGTVANIFTTTADATTTPGFVTAAPVPEPSTLLLSGFGMLALIRRKR